VCRELKGEDEVKNLYLLGILIVISSGVIFSGCGKNYSDDDAIRHVQEQKNTIDDKEVEMIDLFDKVLDDVKWERKKPQAGLDYVLVRGTTKINNKKVECEITFEARVSVWTALKFSFFRINGIEQPVYLGYEFIIKKYKGENVKAIEDQFDIAPDKEECAQFFKDLLNYQRKGIDFDEKKYTKMLREYKGKSHLQEIKEKGTSASDVEGAFLKLAEAIPQDEDVVEVSKIDDDSMKITIRTKAIDYVVLKSEYEKYAIKTMDEYSGSSKPSYSVGNASERYFGKKQIELDQNIKEYMRRYEVEHGNLVGCHPGRVELQQKAIEEYKKVTEEIPRKILDMVIKDSKLKLNTQEIVMVINWRDKKAYQDINVDGKTIHDKTIAQILDKSIFANVGRDDVVFEMSSSYSLFSKFYGHDIYWKPLKI